MKVQIVRPNQINADDKDCFEFDGKFKSSIITPDMVVIYLGAELNSE